MDRLRSIKTWGERLPTWPFAVLVALCTWQIGMQPPGAGLDASWNAGLAIAADQGMQFGREIVFSYGPLGFLQGSYVWFPDLAVLAFLFSLMLYLAFATALLWALRRSLGLLPAAIVAFVALGTLPLLEQPLLLAVIASLALLETERSGRFLWAFTLLAASFAAVETLVKLSTGPVIVAVFVLALLGARARWTLLAAFAALFGLELLVLWLAAGQSLAAVPDFLLNTWQIVSGYSSAMLRDLDVPGWKVTLATIAAALVTVGLVAGTATVRFRDARARWSALALVALAAFIVFKEGVVRTDAGHLTLYFSTAFGLWVAIPWARSRWPALLAVAAAIALAGIPVRTPGLQTQLDPVGNLRHAVEETRTLFSPGRRERAMVEGRESLRALYAIPPEMLAALRGRSVAVEPWEVAAAWAYELDWRPLPVFQNYSAYTTELDELNADAVADPDGPERILREEPLQVFPEFDTPGLDNRYPTWDPPAQARAVICHFLPLLGDARWQVFGRVPDRCGRTRSLGSVEAGEGEAVPVPRPGPGEFVFVRIHGAEVSGLERLAATLLHARIRRIVVDGISYRLVPETATDGLVLRADRRIFGSFPQARTVAVEGGGGELRYEFFATPVSGIATEPR
jgi:hypothetical protein